MEESVAQANLFYFEVAKNGIVWTLCEQGEFPAPVGSDGNRSMPFWSSQERVEIPCSHAPAW